MNEYFFVYILSIEQQVTFGPRDKTQYMAYSM